MAPSDDLEKGGVGLAIRGNPEHGDPLPREGGVVDGVTQESKRVLLDEVVSAPKGVTGLRVFVHRYDMVAFG